MEPYYSYKLVGYDPESAQFRYHTVYPASDLRAAAEFVRAAAGKLHRSKEGDVIISFFSDNLFDCAE